MTRPREDHLFDEFRRTGDPRPLADVFDRTAPELTRVAWYLTRGDVDRAEDALQATFLTAIEDAPSWRPDRRLQPWLLGILANHVRKEARRSRRSRDAVEVELADLAGADAPPRRAEDAEFTAALREAVRELPTTYRQVIVPYLEHGLTAAEIADILDRPAGTVRTQVVRGLELLRRSLPAGFAAGATVAVTGTASAAARLGPMIAAVRERVLSHVSREAAAGAATTVPISMTWRLTVMIATALAAAAALVFVLIPDGAAPPPRMAAPSESVTFAADPGSARGAPRIPLAGVPAVAPVSEPVAAVDGYSLRLTVLFEEGRRPAAGVIAVLEGGVVHRTGRTDADGKVAFEGLESGIYTVFVTGRRPTYMAIMMLHGAVRQEAELVLPRGIELVVRVVDRQQHPVAGARVEGVLGYQGRRMYNPLGRTGADGTLQLSHVALEGQLRAWGPGHQTSALASVRGRLGERHEVVLRTGPPGLVAHAKVRDGEGMPMRGASLAVVQCGGRRPQQPQFFESDHEGRVRIDCLSPGHHIVTGELRRDGVSLRGIARFDHPGAGEHELTLTLAPGASVVGTFSAADGSPNRTANIMGQLVPEAIHELPFTSAFTRTDASGRYVLEGLLPGRNRLHANGDAEVERVVELAPGQRLDWNPVSAAQVPLKIRVVDRRGRPLEGWRAAMRSPDGFPSSGMPLTDDEGRNSMLPWSLPSGEVRELALFAPLTESLPAEPEDSHDSFPTMLVPPVAGGELEHVIIVPDTARPTAWIRGRIVRDDGLPVGRTRVRVEAPRAPGYRVEVWADDDTGAFRIGPFSPGRVEISARVQGAPHIHRALRLGPAQRVDLGDLRVGAVGWLRVRLKVGDRPAVPGDALSVTARSTHGGGTYRLLRQADGSWLSEPLYVGEVTLQVSGAAVAPLRRAVQLAGDETEVELSMRQVKPYRLSVVLPEDHARNRAGWYGDCSVRDSTGEVVLRKQLSHGFRGHFTSRLEFPLPIPEGHYTVRVRTWDGSIGEVDVDVPAGGGGAAELRL